MSRTALITGASSGIGRGAAIRLAEQGWHILAHGRNQTALTETIEKVEAAGGTGDTFCAEMGEMDEVAALANWATSAPGWMPSFIARRNSPMARYRPNDLTIGTNPLTRCCVPRSA